MDSFHQGLVYGQIIRRLEALESKWAVVEYYGKRVSLLLGLAAANALAHMSAPQILSWIIWSGRTALGLTGG